MDFYGVVRAGGQTIDVHRDWFSRPVYSPMVDEDGKRFKLDATGDDKWGGDNNTYFRLAYSPDLQDVTPGQFFAAVWEFVTKECTTVAGDLSAENFRRGVLLGKGTIYHPDFPYWGSYGPGDAGRQSTTTTCTFRSAMRTEELPMSTTHTPPAAARATLGAIESLLRHRDAHEKPIHGHHGASFICKLPGGQLYFESALEVDTDGSVFAQHDPDGNKHGETSAHDGDDHPLDADAVNFFVLPRGGFASGYGIDLGDIAAVISGDRLTYACLGDFGPATKLGEGSLALHRDLGHERTLPNGTFLNDGIDRNVVTIVFPNSRTTDATGKRGIGVSTLESRTKGTLLVVWLATSGMQFETTELTRLSGPRKVAIPADNQVLLRLLRSWVEEVVASTPHPPTINGRKPVDYLMATLDVEDAVFFSPTPMALGRQPPRPVKTVYARFEVDTDTDVRWFVRGITFTLDPPTKAAAP